MEKIGVAIIGAGAVGCAIALELAKLGKKDIFLLEKAPYLADGQSGRNSGVVHAGIYYKNGSLKAKLCIEGNRLMYEFCHKNNVPCVKTGKLIVAVDKNEEKKLEELFERGKKNGAENLKLIGAKEVKNFEPNISAVSAIHAPSTGSVDAATYVKTLARIAESLGVNLLVKSEVVSVERKRDTFVLEIKRADKTIEKIETEILINSAGLYSDKVAKMIDPRWNKMLLPLRGEYYRFYKNKRAGLNMKGMNVYPAPQYVMTNGIEIEVVGVHLTPTFGLLPNGSSAIGNTVTVGPEFVPSVNIEDYESNRKPKELFFEKARKFFPNLKMEDLEPDFTGIMANMGNGHDWIIDKTFDNCVNLVGIDTPALTSSLAIAKYISSIL